MVDDPDLGSGELRDPEIMKAWNVWCRRGVILPGYARDIARLRRLHREWGREEEPLR